MRVGRFVRGWIGIVGYNCLRVIFVCVIFVRDIKYFVKGKN